MKIEFNEKFNFNHITAEEGMVITDWNKEDIKEYNSSKEMYAPASRDLSAFYEITDAEDAKYVEERDAAFRAEEEARREEIEKGMEE